MKYFVLATALLLSATACTTTTPYSRQLNSIATTADTAGNLANECLDAASQTEAAKALSDAIWTGAGDPPLSYTTNKYALHQSRQKALEYYAMNDLKCERLGKARYQEAESSFGILIEKKIEYKRELYQELALQKISIGQFNEKIAKLKGNFEIAMRNQAGEISKSLNQADAEHRKERREAWRQFGEQLSAVGGNSSTTTCSAFGNSMTCRSNSW